MTFKDVAIKNFKGSIRKYITYYLCNSFIIMTFFMYSTLMFNDKLSNSDQVAKGALDTLKIPSVSLVLFSIVFISYAHSTFIRGRKKEFGLFMSLGMSIGDIRRIIVYENIFIGVAAIILGIISGLVFSRLFFLIIIKSMEITGIEYIIGIKNFLFPIGIFILIYLVNMLVTMISTCKFEIIKLIKEEKKNQYNKINNPRLALVGFGLVLGMSIILYIEVNLTTNLLFESMIIIAIGTYLMISQFGGFLIKISKKNKNKYYKNLLFITNINSKFKENKKIIFITSMLIAVIVFYSGMTLRFYLCAEKEAIKNNTYDITYLELGEKNIIPDEKINEIVKNNGEDIVSKNNIECIYYYGKGIFTSNDEINKLNNANLEVDNGRYVYLTQYEELSDQEEYINHDTKLEIPIKNNIYVLQKSNNLFKDIFRSDIYWLNDVAILNKNDYEFIKKKSDNYEIGNIKLYNFKNWENTYKISVELEDALKNNNIGKPNFRKSNLSFNEDNYLKVASKIGNYKENKQGSAILIFTSSYLGVFFFVAISIILFLKLLSSVDCDKNKYQSMYKIGMTEKEIKKQIEKELLPIFFIGPVIGCGLAFVYSIAFSKGSSIEVSNFIIKCDLIVFMLFLIIQVGFFNICKYKYSRLILESER
ncbi:ABC transporter permease [Clostridium gelidum]|uniref:ABC transporter permease n=1 Tax=Clostridium gelidum TaxID=704125 RepID=A0ABM7T127_9CLOT|nr:ABC transporter permease [Clostridium gelidum]BCZ45613.1 ABC transporter permease [Clostridium gelidum]